MECREIKKSIPGFFSDELEGKELTEFIAHISQCEECKEEVTIQYLATEGIVRLEKGQTFELDKELLCEAFENFFNTVYPEKLQ